MLNFKKMHGLGNDFVVIGNTHDPACDMARETIKAMADRRYGIGCDQLLVVSAPESSRADLFMRIYNPDGSEAGACGNGTRCVAQWFMAENGCGECVIETSAGLLSCRRADESMVQVDMGPPRLSWDEIPLAKEADTLDPGVIYDALGRPVIVNMGNPHAVFFVDDVDAVPLGTYGPAIEHHELFPERINVEFAQILPDRRIRVKVWERGAGITQACGSGACAVLVVAVRRGLLNNERKAEIILDGGALFIEWDERSGHVLMTGPAVLVFEGRWPD